VILISTEVLREIRRDIAENLGKPGVARMSDDNGLLRQVFQPLTRCCHPPLRQCDRNTRAQGRFQRVV